MRKFFTIVLVAPLIVLAANTCLAAMQEQDFHGTYDMVNDGKKGILKIDADNNRRA